LSVSMRALYFFLGSICISGGFDHCFAIYISPKEILPQRTLNLRVLLKTLCALCGFT
jgi:hypothetical protein